VPKYGFVASGGGYRSFYTAGALVWLQQNNFPVVHLTSTSSGNNIVIDYLLWDRDKEPLPPVLGRTMRLSLTDIAQVFSNFLGLRPKLIPTGSHLFTVNKDSCRQSLLLDEEDRRRILADRLGAVSWDILATNLTKRRAQSFNVNALLAEMTDASLDRFMDVFIAAITTIPYFKAITIDGEYFIEGGYIDNTPMRTIFEDPEVDEIIAIDFTNFDYHRDLKELYSSSAFTLPLNSIDMLLLVSDLQLTLPNAKIFTQAALINVMLEEAGKESMTIGGRTFYRKPLHILRPKDLESMTVSLKDSAIQKSYFELGKQEVERLLATA
jgi:predicted acylesterase/phospholipase RssA